MFTACQNVFYWGILFLGFIFWSRYFCLLLLEFVKIKKQLLPLSCWTNMLKSRILFCPYYVPYRKLYDKMMPIALCGIYSVMKYSFFSSNHRVTCFVLLPHHITSVGLPKSENSIPLKIHRLLKTKILLKEPFIHLNLELESTPSVQPPLADQRKWVSTVRST